MAACNNGEDLTSFLISELVAVMRMQAYHRSADADCVHPHSLREARKEWLDKGGKDGRTCQLYSQARLSLPRALTSTLIQACPHEDQGSL